MFSAFFLITILVSCSVGRQILPRNGGDDNKIQPYHLPANATAIRSLITYTFSCNGRSAGYYADMDNDCQIFHICSRSTQNSFLCPNDTIFNQELSVCVHSGTMGLPCEESYKYYPSGLEGSPDETNTGTDEGAGAGYGDAGTTTEMAEDSSTTVAAEEEAATTARSAPVEEEESTSMRAENEAESMTNANEMPEEMATAKSVEAAEEQPAVESDAAPMEAAAEEVAEADTAAVEAETPLSEDIENERAAEIVEIADAVPADKEAPLNSDNEADNTVVENDIQYEKTNAHHKYARKSFLFKADAITSH